MSRLPALLFCIAIPASALAQSPPAVTKDWTCFASKESLSEAEINVNAMRFNNFLLVENVGVAPFAGRYPTLTIVTAFSYSATNHGSQVAIGGAELAGFDNDGRLVFATYAGPARLEVQPGASEVARTQIILEKSWLAEARQYCLLIRTAEAAPGK